MERTQLKWKDVWSYIHTCSEDVLLDYVRTNVYLYDGASTSIFTGTFRSIFLYSRVREKVGKSCIQLQVPFNIKLLLCRIHDISCCLNRHHVHIFFSIQKKKLSNSLHLQMWIYIYICSEYHATVEIVQLPYD